jgi:hypothetical protein
MSRASLTSYQDKILGTSLCAIVSGDFAQQLKENLQEPNINW